MTSAAADRAKAAEVPKGVSPDLYAAALLTSDWEASELGIANLRDRIVETRAAARADADAHWKAAVEGLAEEWDDEHADWCCQRGCPNFHDVHPGPVELTTEGGIQQVGPDFPCPGECTCYVGPFRDRLRGLVTDNSEAGQ